MISMRYDFVSYSQRRWCCRFCQPGCLWLVCDTILSAIHNWFREGKTSSVLFMISMRYDFVSYSQRGLCRWPRRQCCLWLVCDTILSAIHNWNWMPTADGPLFMISMRYDFVSYSQPDSPRGTVAVGCLWLVCDTILSAIHNGLSSGKRE